MSQAVDFINNKLQYRFIDLNINVTLTFEDGDFLFIPGFQSTDSNSHLNVPRDLFAALFFYTIQYGDLSNNDFTKMKYAMDASGWPITSYSDAIVEVSNQINSGSLFQNVKYDYIRYVLKQITGNNTTNGLFRNTDQLLSTVVSMDAPFNSQILAILATCGTINSPKLNNTFYNNPGRVLIDSIIANDNVIETDNTERRKTLISQMNTNVTAEYNSNNALYAIGTITGQNVQYCYYPIYNNNRTVTTPITFEEYPGYTFYASSPSSYTNYETTFNKAYYINGTTGGTTSNYYPIYLNKTTDISTAVVFAEYAVTFYTDELQNNQFPPPGYINITSLNDIAYYVTATKLGEKNPKVYFPLYINGTGRQLMKRFLEYDNITFYTDASTSPVATYVLYNNNFITSKRGEMYINATRTNTHIKQDYKIYLNKNYTDSNGKAAIYNPVTFTDASYAGTTFYSEFRNYDTVPCYLYATKLDGTLAYYYPISDISSSVYNVPIRFTEGQYANTYYTIADTPNVNNPPTNYPNYDGFYLYGTILGTTTPQYYPVYLKSNGIYTTPIKFIEYPNKTFFTDYINYNMDMAYYVNGTIGTTAQFYFPIYKSSTSAHSTLVTFTDPIYSGILLYTTNTGLSLPFSLNAPGGYLNIETAHYYKDTDSLYYYPIYISNSGTHTTPRTFDTLTLYTTTLKFSNYDSFAFTSYGSLVTRAYYIIGTKTGSTVSDTHFPIYVNYTGHYGRTPITFTNYPDLTFYTDYEEVNNHFYPFTFEYGDSLSVRITYKPKYNTYLGREIKDYSYQVYLDMGVEQHTTTAYKLTGDENPSNNVVARLTNYDSIIYTSLGIQKVFHYVTLNSKLPSLYESPYNFYPTLNDISNVSFDVNEIGLAITGRWFFSIFCRPRTNGLYDSIGFDRFDTENLPVLNTWTTYNLTTLKWTNNTVKNLTWKNVLELPFEAITAPYGEIKTNGQQQIMVLAISTDTVSCAGSIRKVSVVFNDGRTFGLS